MIHESHISDGPIVVDISIFHERWRSMFDSHIPLCHIEKTEEIRNKFSCFRTRANYYNKNNGKTGGAKGRENTERAYEFPTTHNMRPRIGLLFTNTEGKARKNFTSFMNKLSPQNKGNILQNFVKSLVPENIHIYIDQIITLFQVQPTYHDLYMEVLYEIIKISPDSAKTFLETNFNNFISEEKYKIPESILENLDQLNVSNEQIDQLCEYVKWKKKTKAVLSFYIHCLANRIYGCSFEDVNNILSLLIGLVHDHWHYHAIVDVYLDITLHCCQCINTYFSKGMSMFPFAVMTSRVWDDKKEELKPSSRFKILDIIDIINKK